MSELIPNSPSPNELPSIPPTPPASILETWLKAVTRPSEQTYRAIAASPSASLGRALLWVFVAALPEMIVYFLVQGSLQSDMQQATGGSGALLPSGGVSPLLVVCGAPAAAAAMLLSFLVSSGITHGVAHLFSGRGTYGQWAYAMSAIFVPMALVSTVLLAFQALGTAVALCMAAISMILALYVIVLQVIAIKAVQQISWGGAVVSIIAIPALLFCISCAIIGVLMLMGPAIGNVFSSINQSLQTVP